eukprot:SAG31_NODE_11087_length_1067_cov_1.544421_3_plen_53_part_01
MPGLFDDDDDDGDDDDPLFARSAGVFGMARPAAGGLFADSADGEDNDAPASLF